MPKGKRRFPDVVSAVQVFYALKTAFSTVESLYLCQGSGTAGAGHTAGGRGNGLMMGEYMNNNARGATTL